MRVAEAIGGTLAERGVEVFFGLVGSGNFAVANALNGAGASFYASRHECGAAAMSDGYARASGKVGVCATHQGPGFTNSLTALTEAAKNRTPLVVLAADTPARVLWSNFKLDQGRIAEKVGAIAERARSAETAAEDAARAIRRARVERRPVVLNIPIDLVELEFSGDLEVSEPPESKPPRPSEGSVSELADLVESSRRPVILAGRGAVVSGAREALEELGERIGALLTTSAMGHGLFSGLPYSVGVSGGFASPLAVEKIGGADLVLAFGASLNHWTARHGKMFPPEAKIAQIDLEAEKIGALHRADAGVIGDAKETAKALVEELELRGVQKIGFRTDEVKDEISTRRWRDEPYGDEGTDEYIDPRALSIALDGLLPAERTVSTDSGHFLGYPAMYLDVPDERGFVFPNAFQSVGRSS